MWHFLLLFGIISDHLWDSRTMVRAAYPDCNPPKQYDEVKGCPKTIPVSQYYPITQRTKVIAGIIWSPTSGKGGSIPQQSCQGDCTKWWAESEYTTKPNDKQFPPLKVEAIIINPGCSLFVWRNDDYATRRTEYKGPDTFIPVTEDKDEKSPFYKCKDDTTKICANSLLWTCKQTLPDCEFSDLWRTVAHIDNSLSDQTITFSYEKTVGVKYSYALTQSNSVSTRVQGAVTAALFGFAFDFGISKETNYNWKTVDTEVKSKAETYNVQVTVAAGKKIQIQVAVGICGDNNIHTQLYRAMDAKTNKTLQIYNGKVTYHKIVGKKKGKGKGRK